MGDLFEELTGTRRRLLDLAAHMRQQSVDWRQRVHAEMDVIGAEEPEDQADGVPEGAPAQYAAVRDRVARGELDWLDVLAGRVDDAAARAVHVWLDDRMEMTRQACRLLEQGASLDEAVAGVAVGRERDGGQR
ncbi:hypothetical protein [Micromonospora coxensis]|uniref:hypothetical protein n=1 Tax=Micromonospora coxensis TaxID=356852 RepID=UPI000B5B03D0|nr:hypothetical protein [Micromonospora coxensis]